MRATNHIEWAASLALAIACTTAGCSIGKSTDSFGSAASLGGEPLGTIGGVMDPTEAGDGFATFGGGTGSPPADGGPTNPNEMCNGVDDDGNGLIDDGLGTLPCGMGMCANSVPACDNGVQNSCVPLPGSAEVCNNLDDDCDGTTDEDTQTECSTECGAGTETCDEGVATCDAPLPEVESCNYNDDNCDGTIDENLVGCRVSVHRAFNSPATAHLLTTSLVEANSGGFQVQIQDFFDVYASAHPGLVALYRCLKGNGKRFYTQSAACEGTSSLEGTLGYISANDVSGAGPLYRLYHGPSGNHFYTTSAAERDSAVAKFGYTYESIAGYVF